MKKKLFKLFTKETFSCTKITKGKTEIKMNKSYIDKLKLMKMTS